MEKKVNYISLAIENIWQLFKNGGFAGNDAHYSYWLIVWNNGEEEVVDNFSVEYDGLPKMNARKIKEIRSWFSGGPGTNSFEEIYRKDSYQCNERLAKQNC